MRGRGREGGRRRGREERTRRGGDGKGDNREDAELGDTLTQQGDIVRLLLSRLRDIQLPPPARPSPSNPIASSALPRLPLGPSWDLHTLSPSL